MNFAAALFCASRSSFCRVSPNSASLSAASPALSNEEENPGLRSSKAFSAPEYCFFQSATALASIVPSGFTRDRTWLRAASCMAETASGASLAALSNAEAVS